MTKRIQRKERGTPQYFDLRLENIHTFWTTLKETSEQVKNEVRHEQAYLSREIDKLGKLEYWPDDWVPSFKYKCCPSWLKSWFVCPSIPLGARIILFHGLPNPPEAIIGRSGKWYRHIQPSPWIKDYWTTNE